MVIWWYLTNTLSKTSVIRILWFSQGSEAVTIDHSPLKALLNASDPSGKLATWGQILLEFDLDIRYKTGWQNANADALS